MCENPQGFILSSLALAMYDDLPMKGNSNTVYKIADIQVLQVYKKQNK